MKTFLPLFSLLFCLAACFDNADGEGRGNSDPEGIYQDFQVWAEEGREDVTIRLQFRTGGEDGDGVLINGPGAVLLDNTPLAADSTKFAGVYYEAIKPAHKFTGKHTILFTDKDQKQQKVEFNFTPFFLAKEIPEKVRLEPFEIELNSFSDAPTTVRLVMIDTSLFSADVNEEILVENGKFAVTAEHLANLTKGPVMLEIYREEEIPLDGESKHSGKLTLTYSIKREFVLVDGER